MQKVIGYILSEIKQDKLRWIALVLALATGVSGVLLVFDGHLEGAAICGVFFILSLWLMR